MVLTSDVVVVLKEVCMYKPKSSCCCYSFCNVDILSLVCMYVRMSSYAYMPCFLTLYRHDFVVFLYFFSAQYINGVQPSSNQTKHTLKCWIKMIAFLLSSLQWKSYGILFLYCQSFFPVNQWSLWNWKLMMFRAFINIVIIIRRHCFDSSVLIGDESDFKLFSFW